MEKPPSGAQPENKAESSWHAQRRRLAGLSARGVWWSLLDRWEDSARFRRVVYGSLVGVVLLGGAATWAYPHWTRRNVARITRGWIESGHLNYAIRTIQDALTQEPDNPAYWQLAAELARLNKQPQQAVANARRAAELRPGELQFALAWASEALQADELAEAQRAMATIAPGDFADSPHAQRLLGEIARRRFDLTEAQQRFETALKLEGPNAANEVPLGLILLHAVDATTRQRGLDLLGKWAADVEWGAPALRALLRDARDRGDRKGLRRWGDALRTHPRVTMADMPDCLRALAETDAAKFAEVLAALERDHAATPDAAAQLLGWLNQIGRSADAVRWMRTLPPAAMQRPPLAVVGAEALRQTGDWEALRTWTSGGDWGGDVDFLRWLYAREAARGLGQTASVDELWRTIENHAQMNGAHGYFTASSLYSWGHVDEAERLLWKLADHRGEIAIQALGMLARHFQTRRDADGQYRAFRKLHALHPADDAVSNNYVFFAALAGDATFSVEQLARQVVEREPANLNYIATLGFVLARQQKAAAALGTLEPHRDRGRSSPGFGFAYGVALATAGRRAEARTVFAGVPASTLTTREAELIAELLRE